MAIDREHQDHRRKTILELLAERPVRRQMEIGNALRQAGFKVTQSTVSRDLEALGVVRREGVYKPLNPAGTRARLARRRGSSGTCAAPDLTCSSSTPPRERPGP